MGDLYDDFSRTIVCSRRLHHYYYPVTGLYIRYYIQTLPETNKSSIIKIVKNGWMFNLHANNISTINLAMKH